MNSAPLAVEQRRSGAGQRREAGPRTSPRIVPPVAEAALPRDPALVFTCVMPDALLLELDTLVVGALVARREAIARAFAAEGHAPGDAGALDDTARELIALRAARHYGGWLAQGVVLAEGAVAAVADAATHVPVAVVTRGTREQAAHVLALAGLEAVVRCVVAAEDVCDGEPAPEGHELALGRLSRLRPIAAARALALQDSPAGVAAARRAGLRVVAVGQFAAHEAAEADAFVPSLAGHGLRSLARLADPGEHTLRTGR
jgi:beta-phosphoglucomutase-like phosphatase (HAD superfamily)